MNINKIELGNRIKAIRKSKKMTLEEFGRTIGSVGKSNVSKWEKGYVIPTEDRLEKIAELAQISVYELIYGDTLNFISDQIGAYLPNEYTFLDGLFTHEHLSIISNLIDKKQLSLDDFPAIARIVRIVAPEVEDDLAVRARRLATRINQNLTFLQDRFHSDRTGYFHQKFGNEKKFINHLKKMNSSEATNLELIQSLPLFEKVCKELKNYQRSDFLLAEMPTYSLLLPVFLDRMSLYEVPVDGQIMGSVMVKVSQTDNYSETLSLHDEVGKVVYVVPKINEPEDIDVLVEENKTCFVVVGYKCYCGKLLDAKNLIVAGETVDISNHRFLSRLLALLY